MRKYTLNLLKDDIRNGNFYAVYQPIVSKDNLQIVYSEVLTRLKGNYKVCIQDVIELAERNGLIQEIYNLITNKVGQFLYFYENQLYDVERLTINVSPYQLTGSAFQMYRKLTYYLFKWHVKPSRIAFEITESKEIRNVDEVNKLIYMLRQSGFLIMLDDYGSAYSNLNSLIDFEFDLVKIDKHLIDRLSVGNNFNKVMFNINALKNSGYKILIEGIDKDNFTLASKIPCDYYQGFIYSKPLMTTDYLRTIRTRCRYNSVS